MPKLNQIIALVKAKKGRAASVLSEHTARFQKPGLLDGISRQYQPRADDGEQLPSESKPVQVQAMQAFDAAMVDMCAVLDLVLTQDKGNTEARADVMVGSLTIAEDCPVSYLLFLERKLKEIEEFVNCLPTLDSGDAWSYDDVSDCYASRTKQTVHTRKVPKNHVKAIATTNHPAQVETYMEDVIIGHWNTTKFSGAIPAREKNDMLARVRYLQDAVKVARETANSIDVRPQFIGESLVRYIRGDTEGGQFGPAS